VFTIHFIICYLLFIIHYLLFVTRHSEPTTKESLRNNQQQITNLIVKKRSPQIKAFATILT